MKIRTNRTTIPTTRVRMFHDFKAVSKLCRRAGIVGHDWPVLCSYCTWSNMLQYWCAALISMYATLS